MKKKLAIIMAALVLGSFAACSTQEIQTSSDTTGTVGIQNVKDTDYTEYFQADTDKISESDEKSMTSSAETAENSTEKSTVSENTVSHPDKKTITPSSENIENGSEKSVVSEIQSSSSEENSSKSSVYTANTSGKLDTADFFSNRDLAQTADTSNAVTITAQDNKTETVKEEGVYILTGSASNFTVIVEADKQYKIQLVPVIYVVSADKCFITTANTENTLSVTGTFRADGDTNTDAVIFSKDDLTFNGTGTLNITSTENGISCKDDIKFTGGNYNIQSAKDSIEANDSILIYDGTFNITSSKDGLHSENDDDDSVGYIYIQNGNFNIKASSDAVQATTVCQIDGGKLVLNGKEGIEATCVQINDGEITITGADDGINAGQKTNYSTPTIEINGGTIKVTVGEGDTDAIDSNGDIIVNGGTIDITSTVSSFDYDGTATYNGGTIIINGEQVDSIPEPAMMGPGGGMGPGGNAPG